MLSIYYSNRQSSCVRNKPKSPGKPLPNAFPGQLMSRNEQCQRYNKDFYAEAVIYTIKFKLFDDYE